MFLELGAKDVPSLGVVFLGVSKQVSSSPSRVHLSQGRLLLHEVFDFLQ